MSSVVWYYSVGGNVSSPLTWEELSFAVKEGKVGPNDLVWTSAFGSEWRKASTLEGLFGTNEIKKESALEEEIEPIEDDVCEIESEEIPLEIKADTQASEEATDNDFTQNAQQQSKGGVTQGVKVLLGLKRAYDGMVNLLFAQPFNIMRWIPLAVALFLASQLSSSFLMNATGVLLVGSDDIRSTLVENSEKLGIDKAFFSRGVFSKQWKEDSILLQNYVKVAQEKQISQEKMAKEFLEIYDRQIDGIGLTCCYIWDWFKSTNGIFTVAMFFVMVFVMKITMFWFGSRGKFIAMYRCLFPNIPFGITWRIVASASNRFFRMLVAIELITSSIFFILSLAFIRYVAHAYVDKQLSIEHFVLGVGIMFCVYSLFVLLNNYLQDFVALPFLFEKKRITPGYIFKGFGFWVVRYGIVYMLLLILIQVLLSLVGLLVGPSLIQQIFSMPVSGQLLALPIFIIHLLWTMNITLQMRPELLKKLSGEYPFPNN